MAPDSLDCFADNYRTARAMFLAACDTRAMQLTSFTHPLRGPDGGQLALDAALRTAGSSRLLIVSSGLHGAEGLLGGALQVDALRRGLLERAAESGWSVLLLHALNPHGVAYARRWDEGNVDPNRNFLLPGQEAEGSHPLYAQLDPLLNPRRKPAWHDGLTFYLRAGAATCRHGFTKVKQAVAEGQYDRPQGLFYGGQQPCWTQSTLAGQLPGWLEGMQQVVHVDFHSGLGRWGSCKLLLDYPVRPWQREWLESRFEADRWEDVDPSQGDAYNARGGLGQWCHHTWAEHHYLYLCAEFGTYGPLRMTRALRLENQAWQAGQRPPRLIARIKELFCPASPRWRTTAAETSWSILGKVCG